MLSREIILTLNDVRVQAVDVPQWGGSLYVRSLAGSERAAFFAALGSDSLTAAHMVAWCASDEKGNRLFSDADIEALSKKDGKALDTVANAALQFNGLVSTDAAKND